MTWRRVCAGLAMLGFGGVARAQTPPAAAETPVPGQAAGTAASGSGIWQRANLLGDAFGAHAWLDANGLGPALTIATDLWRNTTGGYKTETDANTLAVFSLDVDAEKLLGIAGGTAHASVFGITGSTFTPDAVGSLAPVSSIEAERALRLFELWYEQNFFHGALTVRLGQLAADQEFLVSPTAQVLLNSDFGWPTLAAIDLPAGGPAYPLATPGVRFKLSDGRNALLLGVFNGNEVPNSAKVPVNPQIADGSGTLFTVRGGVFVIAEAQFPVDVLGGGTYKLGAWWNSNGFADQHYDTNGISLASPASNGDPATRQGNWSFYGMADQVLWHLGGSADRGVTAFLRVMGAPADRNLLSVEIDGGLTAKGVLAARPNDTLGVGVGWFSISPAASALDRDRAALAGGVVRKAETLVEMSYQAAVTPWLQVQPDVQWDLRPGGGLPGVPPDRLLRDTFVIGARTTITF